MIRGQTSLSPSGPKTKLDPTKAKSSSRLIAAPETLEHRLAERGLQHQEREDHLQRQPPGHRPPIDRAPVGRERVRHRHDDDEADERLQLGHAAILSDERADRRAGRRGPEHHGVLRIVGRALQGRTSGRTVCLGHETSLANDENRVDRSCA